LIKNIIRFNPSQPVLTNAAQLHFRLKFYRINNRLFRFNPLKILKIILIYLKSGFSVDTKAISISFGFKSADNTVIKQEIAN